MELLQVLPLLASVVLLVGLFKLHTIVVRKHLLPAVVEDEDDEA
ncbi:hypothetical protein ACFQMM_14820 [Saliphagus sp. GCM10025308]